MLPDALTSRLDLDRLKALSGSFVDATLRWRHSDLLFTAPVDCRDAFVYVLVEHQSGEDPLMAFRMLRYIMRIWDRYLSEQPNATRLPAVIPLVVHHNHRAWSCPTDVLDLLDLDRATADAARQYLPRFRFLLDDLARVDEQALRARPLTPQARMTLLLLKIAAGNPRIADELRKWIDDLREILHNSGGIEDFVALLTYIESVGEAPTGELHDLFAQLGPEAEEAYVTTAEVLRSEGRTEGRTEGAVAAKAESVLTVLGARGITVSEAARARITQCTDLAQLETWVRQAVTVTSADDLFA
ncbi:Rpn family recombination-promoting nuclease/putative transposase [Haloechinothrix salitolerans]|uniref:Rpn family recombination-promoting nuclease/putative transposase n=1 Tax=Haloechinothrix salitolerans TaxID=926830 RepID=A0ABW2C071_9PSEU